MIIANNGLLMNVSDSNRPLLTASVVVSNLLAFTTLPIPSPASLETI
ncbi:MAG: hypothetical protein WA421_02180 [Nitrososphaeraceae archaeon]